MQHLEATTYAYANGSCYRCGNASDLVDLDCFIDGEGALAICTTCILDAAAIGRIGRKKLRERAKRDAEAVRLATAV